jgi:hypothetical protein
MRFELAIPDPATIRLGRQSYVTLKGGTELHRLHPEAYKAAQFNGTDKGNACFSPIRDASGQVIPTIYGGQSFACVACEIILRCPDVPPTDPKTGLPTLQIVYPSDFASYRHSVIRTTIDLKLVDLTIAGQRRLGVNQNALLAGPKSTYPVTRAWAERIHAGCPDAQGLYYSSFQYGPDFAIVLFGDRLPAGALKRVRSRPVSGGPCHGEIVALAQSLSIEYVDI